MLKKIPSLSLNKKILLIVVLITPFIYFSKKIITGEIPFWFDSARDFIQAGINLHNPTLIGPPSGIPGVFYGPYWIWLISIGEIITKNPRFTAFLLGVIPYGIIFPIILYQLSKKWGVITGVLVWLLFVTSYAENYATYLWNPHVAPVIFLLYVYVLMICDFQKKERKNLLLIFIAGFLGGLITNFHISFGLGILISSYIWLVGYYVMARIKERKSKSWLINFSISLVIFTIGLVCSFGPFFLFEIKNGFNQIKATVSTITSPNAVVGQTGLDNRGILDQFVLIFEKIFHVSYSSAIGIISVFVILSTFFFVRRIKQKKSFDFKLVSLLITFLICLVSIYLWSKNPVWEYHFIGVEIIVLLLIGVVLSQSKILQGIVSVWVLLIVINFSIHAIQDLKTNKLTVSTLYTKEYVVDQVYNDAQARQFETFVYSPSIYTYDYSYIFGYKGTKKYVPARPEEVQQNSDLVYIILPPGEEGARQDFIHYRTPIKIYKTTKVIDIPDGTQIVRREKIMEEK